MPASKIEILLDRASKVKRTHPPERAGESITAVEIWRLVYDNQRMIKNNMPDAPPEIQRALAEQQAFEDCCTFFAAEDAIEGEADVYRGLRAGHFSRRRASPINGGCGSYFCSACSHQS